MEKEPQEEVLLVQEAQENGTMDNPELDPPDVAEVDNNGNTSESS